MLRKERILRVAIVTMAATAFHGFCGPVARACELCGPPSVTLAEQLATAQEVLLVKWIGAQFAVDGKPGSVAFEVVRVLRPAGSQRKPGETIRVDRYLAGERGRQYLLFGKPRSADGKGAADGAIDWSEPTEATEITSRYLLDAPRFDAPATERLAYYAKFLEHAELVIANDAHAEFVNAKAEEIAAAAGSYSREKLRAWLSDRKTPINRLAAYGLMLGHCGQADDVPFLERLLSNTSDPRRSNSSGIMAGLIFLARDGGVQKLERLKLADRKGSVDEAYSALQAVRYAWSYGGGKVSRTELERVVRNQIDRPEFFDTVVVDLARWKDWSIMPRLMELYGTKDFNDRTSKTTIVRYLIAATKDVPPEGPKPQHAIDADRHLAKLREQEPRLVLEVEKFFYLK
jgi:hypothetical protein